MSLNSAADWSAAAVALLKNVRDVLDKHRVAASSLAFLVAEPKIGNFVNPSLFSIENISKISQEVLTQRRHNYTAALGYRENLPEIKKQLRSQLALHIETTAKHFGGIIQLADSAVEMRVLLGGLMRPEVGLRSRMADILDSLDKAEEINAGQTIQHTRMLNYIRSQADRDDLEPNRELAEWANCEGLNGSFLQADWSTIRTRTSVLVEKLAEKLIGAHKQAEPDIADAKKILVEATWGAAKEMGVRLDSNAVREAIRPVTSPHVRAQADNSEFQLTS